MGHRLVCLAAVATVGFVAAACGDDGADGGADDGGGATPELSELSGQTFTSSSVEGATLVDDTVVSLMFDDDSVAAIAGCNTMRSGASITDGALAIEEPMASTMMACSEELTAQDQWLQEFLAAGPVLTLDGDELTLTADDTTLIGTLAAAS